MSNRAVILAAAQSGSGKTLITLGLLHALQQQGHVVSAAKSGPDYIDLAFLEAASMGRAVTLDPWAMRAQTRRSLLASLRAGADLTLIEGALGLFDGAYDGTGSTADLAAELNLPVIIVLNARGLGATAGALLQGLIDYRDDVRCVGVIFNQTGGTNHRSILEKAAVEAGLVFLGAIPRHETWHLPSRHLGLVQAAERGGLSDFIAQLAATCRDHVDLERLADLAETSPPTSASPAGRWSWPPLGQHIAVARDQAFSFIYPHILSGWRAAGSSISFFSPLADEKPNPAADAIFLPGGYPELHAATLANARAFMQALKDQAAKGTIIYGECGGYIALGQKLEDKDGKIYPMANLLPVSTSYRQKKIHLGYRKIMALQDSPLGRRGTLFRGHEFHYTSLIGQAEPAELFRAADSMQHDLGIVGHRNGTVFGSYLHLIDYQDGSLAPTP